MYMHEPLLYMHNSGSSHSRKQYLTVLKITSAWLCYITPCMQVNLALTPDKILLRRTPTMPDAPAIKGKARSLLALAPNQPSLPASCSVNGGFKLASIPGCDWGNSKDLSD